MITEVFGYLAGAESVGKGIDKKFTMNMNKNRIRSISAYSSNSIFYFPVITSDQISFSEMGMISRMVERSYASFTVACISLMPFHRVRADDKASIEDYLSQFHQNIGIKANGGDKMGKMLQALDSLEESAVSNAEGLKALQDFLLESWEKAKATNSDFIKIVNETISINDMYQIDPIDPKTKVLQEQYMAIQEELATWGFLGEATDSMFDDDTDELLNMSDEEIFAKVMSVEMNGSEDDIDEDEFDDSVLDEGTVKGAIDSIKFSLESVSANKIMSCNSLTKLASLEARLNKLKNKYTKYLNRYKNKYNENKKSGSKSKLSIRFNNVTISNPKLFMQKYGSYIKVINKRLKLVEKRREELRKRKGLPTESKKLEENVLTDLTNMDMQAIDHCINLMESALNAPDSEIFILSEAQQLTPDEYEDLISILQDELLDKQNELNTTKDQATAAMKRFKTARDNAVTQAQQQSKARKESDRKNELLKKYGTKEQRKHITDMEKEIARLEKLQSQNTVQRIGRRGAVSVNEPIKVSEGKKLDLVFDKSRGQSSANVAAMAANGQMSFKTFDKEVFTNMDMKKANDALPTFTHATIGFIVDETEEVVSRDVLIGIKAYIHRVPSLDLINDMYNCIINQRKFLKFVKYISGEEKSLADLLFGFKELRYDALDSREGAGKWRSAFKRRKRLTKMSIPYLMKEYTPNGTVVMTKNEVDFIKSEYGVDIMDPAHVNMIMNSDFLLGFVIVDQTNEVVYVTYDGHGGEFQEYTYAMLERSEQTTDRMMRELYRTMAR